MGVSPACNGGRVHARSDRLRTTAVQGRPGHDPDPAWAKVRRRAHAPRHAGRARTSSFFSLSFRLLLTVLLSTSASSSTYLAVGVAVVIRSNSLASAAPSTALMLISAAAAPWA